jgi:N-acetylneuraminic acid mutarotase
MPTARTALSAAAGNGILYAIGGGNGVNLTVNEAYDPVSNTWSTKAPYPGPPICFAAAGYIAGKLYLAGGWFNCDSSSTTNALAIYDPLTDAWTYGPSMPSATGDATAAVVGGKLYVVGGRQFCGPCNGPFFTTVQVYDPVTATWDSSRAPRPVGAFGAPGAEVGGVLYAIGGNTGVNCCSTQLDAYSVVGNSWTTKAPMPTGRYQHVAGAIGGVVYAVGGSTATSLTVNEAYDPIANAWTTKAPMPTARGSAASAVINGVLYVVGGQQASPPAILATNEAFTP